MSGQLPLVTVVGLGMGLDDVTPAARTAIEPAQVLAGGARVLSWFPHHPARRLPLEHGLAGWLEEVARAAEHERVVVLASGDPGFYGVAARLRARLGERLRVIPGISAVQAACARLGLDWHQAETVSLHGRGMRPLFSAMVRADLVAAYTDPAHSPDVVARALLERGQNGWRMHVAQDMGSPEEKLGIFSLEQAAGRCFSPLNLLVLERIRPAQTLALGMAEEAFGPQRGLITKREVRAVALSLLRLEPGRLLWDLGAGSGSVGLEASRLLYRGGVIAVERDPERVAIIARNRARFGAANLELVQGELPGALAGLPDPDRVFIGGGGADLAAICTASAKRLPPGGATVCAAVRLEAMQAARRAFAAQGMAVGVTLIQASRDRPLAGGSYMKALNPVWLVSADKEQA